MSKFIKFAGALVNTAKIQCIYSCEDETKDEYPWGITIGEISDYTNCMHSDMTEWFLTATDMDERFAELEQLLCG